MAVITKRIHVNSKGNSDMIDITEEVASFVSESKVKDGIVTIFVSGSTASVSTVEYEPGLLKDIPRALDKIAPYGQNYAHHETWHDDNGASHVRSTLVDASWLMSLSMHPSYSILQSIFIHNLDKIIRK